MQGIDSELCCHTLLEQLCHPFLLSRQDVDTLPNEDTLSHTEACFPSHAAAIGSPKPPRANHKEHQHHYLVVSEEVVVTV